MNFHEILYEIYFIVYLKTEISRRLSKRPVSCFFYLKCYEADSKTNKTNVIFPSLIGIKSSTQQIKIDFSSNFISFEEPTSHFGELTTCRISDCTERL